jgi:hypothetical protein
MQSWNTIMAEPARVITAATAADALDVEVQEALEICGGDAMKALRITLIANAFLEAQIDSLKAEVSSDYSRGRLKPKQAKE